jgi:hypothetical protein
LRAVARQNARHMRAVTLAILQNAGSTEKSRVARGRDGSRPPRCRSG